MKLLLSIFAFAGAVMCQPLDFGDPNHFCDSYTECLETNPEDRCKRWFGSDACTTALDLIKHWQVGDRLEAVDRLNPTLVCVANVKAVHPESGEVEITFDGWSDHWDYTTKCDNADLHPIGYCNYKGLQLQAPKDYSGLFLWPDYLDRIGARAVPYEAFKLHQTDGSPELTVRVAKKPKLDWDKLAMKDVISQDKFYCQGGPMPQSLQVVCERLKDDNELPIPDTYEWRVGMRLEALDRLNPHMIAPANVLAVDHQQGTITINFDGWGPTWDYTARVDDQDFHPIGYAEHVGHALEKPYGYGPQTFKWAEYLNETRHEAVPHHLFTNCQTDCSEPLKLA